MKKEIINICIVFNDSDGEYTKKIFPTLYSILENNKQNKIKIYFICKWIKKEYQEYLDEIFKRYKQDFSIIDNFWEKEYLVEFFKNNNTSSWDYGIFFKLLIPFVLPKDVRKIINFDADDVIVNGDLNNMWNIDLWNHFIASVQGFQNKNWTNKLNLTNPTFRVWWNIYNVDAFRWINFEENFKKILKKYNTKLTTPESDILNIFCNNKVLYIDDTYNFIPKKYNKFHANKIVYHFNDRKFFRFKLIFEVNKEYKKLYDKYYNMSKYRFDKKFNIIRSLNSISFFNFFIKKLSRLLQLIRIRQFIVKIFYW